MKSATPGGEPVYFGLAGTNSTDGREIIGLFQPEKEEFLEYDVASLIYRLSNAKRAAVGLISSLPVDATLRSDERTDGAGLGQHRSSCANARCAHAAEPMATTFPPTSSVLMVVHPKESEPAGAVRDRSVRSCAAASSSAFMDPQSENDNAGAQMGMPPMGGRSSTLGPLLDAWGVKLDPNQDRRRSRARPDSRRCNRASQPSRHIAILGFNRAQHESEGRRPSRRSTRST